jgi:hypothetical protein
VRRGRREGGGEGGGTKPPPPPQCLISFFLFVSKLICMFRFFRLLRYGFETPKRTEPKFFLFSETNRKSTETDESHFVSVRTENLFCLFRGHPGVYVAFSFFSVCFETDLFVSVVSKQVKNTETNRNKNF